jgi:hypothetical protein
MLTVWAEYLVPTFLVPTFLVPTFLVPTFQCDDANGISKRSHSVIEIIILVVMDSIFGLSSGCQ